MSNITPDEFDTIEVYPEADYRIFVWDERVRSRLNTDVHPHTTWPDSQVKEDATSLLLQMADERERMPSMAVKKRLDTRKPASEFPTPKGAGWEEVSIRFIDRHSVYIKAQDVTGIYHYAEMGMVNRKNAMPTVQWELLEAFAEGHGLLDWSSRRADRKNQKRKENLATDLQRFFRIDGDPFVIEGNGWRAHFAVAVRE